MSLEHKISHLQILVFNTSESHLRPVVNEEYGPLITRVQFNMK